MSIENHRRISFLDDISPITADFMNDMQSVVFDTFSNLRLDATTGQMRLIRMEDGYADPENAASIVVAGKQRFPKVSADASDPTAVGDYSILAKPGEDSGANTNLNVHQLDLEVSTDPGNDDPAAGDLSRVVGVTHWDGTKYENTHTTAGAVARAHQYNAFVFESIDGNSTPLSIMGDNDRHPNLYVQSFTSFTRPPQTPDGSGYDPNNTHHENWWQVTDAHGGIQTSHIYADNPENVIVLQDHVHVVGSLTVDEDIIFDQSQLGELGASPWDNLDSAAAVQEFADSTFEGLLPNPSHAPVNFFPLGTVIEWAVGLNFVIDDPKTWPIGWVPAVDSNQFDMDDDCTKAWLTPLYQHFEGAASVPSGQWAVPGGTPTGGAYQPFIFLGSMSYLVEDSATGDLEISEELQGYGHKFGDIVVS